VNLKVNFFELIFIILLLAIAGTCVYAQDKPITTTPSQEKFKDDDGFIQRASNAGTKRVIDMTGNEVAKIYNQDGSLWYEFNYKRNVCWLGKPNAELKPLYYDVYKNETIPCFLLFRIKSTSKNWYEITVNEETGLTKYISKYDEALGRDNFERHITGLTNRIEFDNEKNPLRESPNGEIVKDYQPAEKERYLVEKIEGEWVRVKLQIAQTFGWVRWRENRKILVGYILNNFEVLK
jgi:hypothetical protein